MPSTPTDAAVSPVKHGLIPAAGVSLAAVLLFALRAGWVGYLVLAASLLLAWWLDRELARDLFLIGLGITIVSAMDYVWRMARIINS